MERIDFSNLLVAARESTGISKTEMSRYLGASYVETQRIEEALNNYGIMKVFKYLDYIHACIFLSNKSDSFIICSDKELRIFFKKILSKYSTADLVAKSGLSRSTLCNISKDCATVRIDTFLKIIEVLGYKVDKIC